MCHIQFCSGCFLTSISPPHNLPCLFIAVEGIDPHGKLSVVPVLKIKGRMRPWAGGKEGVSGWMEEVGWTSGIIIVAVAVAVAVVVNINNLNINTILINLSRLMNRYF